MALVEFAMTYAVLLLAGAAGFALAGWMIYRDSPAGIAFTRARLAQKLAGLQLGDMLLHRKVQPSEYVRMVPVAELRRQLRNCRRCPDQARCEYLLAGRTPQVLDLTFCPNNAAINDALRAMRG